MIPLQILRLVLSLLTVLSICIPAAMLKPSRQQRYIVPAAYTTQKQLPTNGKSMHRHFVSSLSSEEREINAIMISSASSIRIPVDNLEIDYLGMIDFCLRERDNALSGPSRSKKLNKITNDIFKALIIGFKPSVDQVRYKNI